MKAKQTKKVLVLPGFLPLPSGSHPSFQVPLVWTSCSPAFREAVPGRRRKRDGERVRGWSPTALPISIRKECKGREGRESHTGVHIHMRPVGSPPQSAPHSTWGCSQRCSWGDRTPRRTRRDSYHLPSDPTRCRRPLLPWEGGVPQTGGQRSALGQRAAYSRAAYSVLRAASDRLSPLAKGGREGACSPVWVLCAELFPRISGGPACWKPPAPSCLVAPAPAQMLSAGSFGSVTNSLAPTSDWERMWTS